MSVKIRPAFPEDADALSLIALSAKSHWQYPSRWLEIWKPHLTFSPDYFKQHESWVVEVDEHLTGFYTLQEKESKAWIENMWVLPEYMGLGLGKQLFLHAVSRSRLKGHLVLRLEADPNAVGFYEKMGMHQVGEASYMIEDHQRILPLMEIQL